MTFRWIAQRAVGMALCVAFVLVVRPVCPVYAMFHVLCPGCGGTRALLALLRGDLAGAWRLNALLVGAGPVVVGYLGVRWWQAGRFVWPETSRVALSLCGAVIVLFTIARNL